MNCTPEVRQTSNEWGAFCMKLSYEDKVQLYELRKSTWTWTKLSQQFDISFSNFNYLVGLIDRHGKDSVRKE